jgi:hypothetical protein
MPRIIIAMADQQPQIHTDQNMNVGHKEIVKEVVR